jgi:hypothetical protein
MPNPTSSVGGSRRSLPGQSATFTLWSAISRLLGELCSNEGWRSVRFATKRRLGLGMEVSHWKHITGTKATMDQDQWLTLTNPGVGLRKPIENGGFSRLSSAALEQFGGANGEWPPQYVEICKLRQLLRSRWQHLGAEGTRLSGMTPI